MKYRMGVAAVLLSLLGAACTFVEPSPQGKSVRLISMEEATGCKRLGKTTAKTLARIAGMPRHEESVRDELLTLARNSAAKMDGDSISPIGEVKEGELTFQVFRCRGE